MDLQKITLSVHELVDFLLRKGDIDTRVFNNETMLEGSRLHLRYQSIQEGNYISEVPLEYIFNIGEFEYTLQGRADGVIKTKELFIIDEIKTTNADLEEFYSLQGEWHLGQAICYAYMYAEENNLSEMGVRLTYISQNDGSKMIKDFVFSKDYLYQKVLSFFVEYTNFYLLIYNHKINRNNTSKNLIFPFDNYRESQREVAKYVYKVSKDGGLFFFEAPTGTGKTMATLFPTVKTFADEVNDKIFYLAAKNQGKQVAYEAMKILSRKGLDTYSIVLSSKEQMCQCDKTNCNPDECPFAKGYYDKINEVIKEVLLKEKNLNRDLILNYALKYGVCPFECQLDISTYCDVIICDYNYMFDPIVHLKRFFEEGKRPYFALIDEAHNFGDRTKEMYTIALEKEKLLNLQKSIRKFKLVGLKRSIKKLLIDIENVAEEVEEYKIYEDDFSLKLYNDIESLISSMQKVTKEHSEYVTDEFVECSRMVNRFIKIHDYLNDNFVTYVEKKSSINLYIRLLDSSDLIKKTLKKIRGAVMFSATMTPMDYYIKTLGGDENTPFIRLSSPFEQQKLCLLVRSDISTKYKNRDTSYKLIADSIKAVITSKVGNYLVFFSSYQYLNDVLSCYQIDEENVIVQEKEMRISDRESFLSQFELNPIKTTVGFAVLGGAFSEGIDLVDSRLIGAIVVGVGLPMISFERDLMKDYYDKQGVSGFDYAYTNPGKNKVMQAAGRVIRSDTDNGVVLLIDERFMQFKYRDLFKVEWSHYRKVNSLEQIKNHLKIFWEKVDK